MTPGGQVVTALHIFGDTKTLDKRIRSARIEAFHDGRHTSIANSTVIGDRYRDTAVVRPREPVQTKRVARVAAHPLAAGKLAHALLMSTRRGSRTWTMSTATVLGYSKDSAFFALAGPATEGDSGGPVLNDAGELIGIVIGGGSEEIGFPFRVEWLEDGHFRTVWLDAPTTKLYKGEFTICARPVLK
jgi:S1-C subfamily serine protease